MHRRPPLNTIALDKASSRARPMASKKAAPTTAISAAVAITRCSCSTSFASFGYQGQSWKKSRRVVAKVEWHPGELYLRVGFVVTNLIRPAECLVAFYNQRGTAEQWIKEDKGDQVDPSVMPHLRRRHGPPSAPCARLQSRQLHADATAAQDGTVVVADQPAREADQDRRQGGQPRLLGYVPAGRGRGVATDVRKYPDAHRPAAGTTCAGVRSAGADV